MLLVAEFPICDARPFSPEAARLVRPSWESSPQPGADFVRCFGRVERRRRGGHEYWHDEVFFSSAARAVRIPQLEKRGLGKEPWRVRPEVAFRRLMSNGRAMTRVEVGLSNNGSVLRDMPGKSCLKVALDMLDLPVEVAAFPGKPTACELRRAGTALTSLYARATSSTKEPVAEEKTKRLVKAGEPLVLIEYEGSEVSESPPRAVGLSAVDGFDVPVSFMWVEYGGRETGVWFVRTDTAPPSVVRRLRVGLCRLHAEHQVLKAVLSMLSSGVLKYEPATTHGDALNEYLEEATRLLGKDEHAGLNQAALKEVISAYSGLVNPDEQKILAKSITQVRVSVRRKLEMYDSMMRAQQERGTNVVWQVGQVNGDIQLGGIRTMSQQNTQNTQTISGGTFHGPVGVNQTFQNCYNTIDKSGASADLKTALETLTKQVEQAAPTLPPEAQAKAQKNLSKLVEEATAAKPDRDWLNLSAKGLQEAASAVASIAGPIASTVATILKLVV